MRYRTWRRIWNKKKETLITVRKSCLIQRRYYRRRPKSLRLKSRRFRSGRIIYPICPMGLRRKRKRSKLKSRRLRIERIAYPSLPRVWRRK